MLENCLITFGLGDDEHSPKPPAGFPHRFALLTWFDLDGLTPPWELLKAALPRVAELAGADEIIAELWIRERKKRGGKKVVEQKIGECSWQELAQKSDDSLIEDEEFPSRFRFLHNGDVVLHAVSELWYLVGGPAPYSDSVTLSFFSSTDLSQELREIFTEEAQLLGVNVRA